jgi:ATP-dependent helicase/nuclease subunit B
MQTILGPFHPYLENALADEILKYKNDDALCPLLLLVPSDALRRRLKILLARERGRSFVNLHLLTFHQLSLRLFSELHGIDAPVLRDDLFFEEALRQIIRARQPGAEAFAGIEERAGGCAALWQTLRDLRDGMVEPALALEALREGHFGRRASASTAQILALFQTLVRFCNEKKIAGRSDLDRWAGAQASSSPFLKQFAQIFYYGFYDLTQVQVDLFHAVAENYPTTLFFPLLHAVPSHEGWSFAERFYQRYVQGRIAGSAQATRLAQAHQPKAGLPPAFRLFDQAVDRAGGGSAGKWRGAILNAFGAHDEIAAVAKEILRLVADDGMGFEEIAVVARSLEGYGPTINEIFRQHCIPVAGALEEPLAQFPLAKGVALLFNLPAKDFLRGQVIDLLSSPYFQLGSWGGEIAPRPDLWDLATRELGICKGVQEWRRLQRYAGRDLILSQPSDDEQPRVVRIAAAQILCLANLFNAVWSDLGALPRRASWTQYAGAWKALLKKYLGIFAKNETEPERPEELIGAAILAILDRMAGLDAIQAEVSLDDFSRTFQHWLEGTALAPPTKQSQGVAALDAAAARGLSFRALFIVGLNEGVFPRTIREDAFLRDHDREVLERDLGYKVNPKLAAFDEEKLIFTLLVSAARERLYCLFQRSDESGRVLAPSWYLAELRRALGNQAAGDLREITIPRGIADKADVAPFDRDELLLSQELAVRWSLAGKDPTSLVKAVALAPDLYKQGRAAVERLDLSSARLDAFDGVVKPLAEHWRRFAQRGLSPTALETYGRCPFQFFALHVLGLERLERPEEITGPSPADFGSLGHEILKFFYQELIERNFFASPRSLDVEPILAAAAHRAFAEYESNNPVGYPLAWESLKENLTQILLEVVAQDLKELAASGFRPIALETDVKDHLAADWPEPLRGLPIRGRMDRVDRHHANHRLRVIDYKFKLGRTATAEDKDLYRAALRGERLQPPFYFMLGKRSVPDHETKLAAPEVEANFYYIAPRWAGGPLVTAGFGSDGLSGKLGAEIKNTISYLADGIQRGRFFIQRGAHCQHCDVAEICRKNHPPSLWRAENDPITQPHRDLHEKDPKKL